jgi:cob(I)alamin adenosyltransferase
MLHPAIDTMLARIQNDLFDLGADLATPDDGKSLGYEPLRMIASQTARIEADIDALNAALQPLRSFVLPGGSPAAAALHLARTVARRAERVMVALAAKHGERVNPEGLKYINRVSDFLFVAARAVNDNGNADVLWVPGQNR